VLVLGSANDVSTYRALTSEGISDYLVGPHSAATVFEAIEAAVIDPDSPPRGQVIAFIGAKGGVGSSTVAANVAWCLAKTFNDDVIMLDLDLAFGTAGLSFNVEQQEGIHDALAAPDRLDEVLLGRFLAVAEENIKVLCTTASLEANADIDPKAFDSLLELVRRTAPFIVLDIPHGWTAWQQHAIMQVDEIVLTSMLDLACLRASRNLVELLESKRANDAPIRLVINHQGAYRKTELSDKDFETAVGGKAELIIEHDPALFGTAANNGQVIGAMKSDDKVVEGFNTLAQIVSGMELSKPKKKAAEEAKPGGLFSFLKRKPKE
jgi:pilus assembly protein CpaE